MLQFYNFVSYSAIQIILLCSSVDHTHRYFYEFSPNVLPSSPVISASPARSGMCDPRVDNGYVVPNCRKSCGSCVDTTHLYLTSESHIRLTFSSTPPWLLSTFCVPFISFFNKAFNLIVKMVAATNCSSAIYSLAAIVCRYGPVHRQILTPISLQW